MIQQIIGVYMIACIVFITILHVKTEFKMWERVEWGDYFIGALLGFFISIFTVLAFGIIGALLMGAL